LVENNAGKVNDESFGGEVSESPVQEKRNRITMGEKQKNRWAVNGTAVM
jgi:hypothetical protein